MLFSAFPIVYQQNRGWSPGIGGLAFLGVAVGMIGAVAYSTWDNKRYAKVSDEYQGFAPPEARLPICMIGGIAIPIGLFWFAWTNYPSIHWMASIAAGVPFGFGMVLVFLGIMNYLIDAYTIFAASVLAANAVMRSIFGAVFPLFTTQMYDALGIHWASTIPAFLAFVCVPFPFLFYKYGPAIRVRCKYAGEAEAFMKRMQNEMQSGGSGDESETATGTTETQEEKEKEREEEEQEAIDYSYEAEQQQPQQQPQFEEIKTNQPRPQGARRGTSYDANPFDLDRVNTRESFKSEGKTSGVGRRPSMKAALSRASSRTSRR